MTSPSVHSVYRPSGDSEFDLCYANWQRSGRTQNTSLRLTLRLRFLAQFSAHDLDELASCARAKTSCPMWAKDLDLQAFAAQAEHIRNSKLTVEA